jgi:glycine/D-amino acid oxidase-like deaminating enzyme
MADVDIAIIGAGAAGLSVAAVAAQLGLKVLLVDCGEGGEEMMRAAARQTIQVAKLWDWVAVNIANDRLTSPGRSTANAGWMTVIGRAMDQRAGLALSGAHTLTDALARLGAVDPVRRQLAPALALQAAPAQLAHGAAYTLAAEAAQPTYAAMYTLGAQHAVDTGPQHAGWALTPAWGAPPPPAYVSPWGAQQQPAYPQQAAQAYVSPGQQPETEVHMDLGGGLAGEP